MGHLKGGVRHYPYRHISTLKQTVWNKTPA